MYPVQLLMFIAAYAGAFLFSFIYYRFVKGRSRLDCTKASFLWMLGYMGAGTTIDDTAYAAWNPPTSNPYIWPCIMAVVVAVPYLAAVCLFLKVRRVK